MKFYALEQNMIRRENAYNADTFHHLNDARYISCQFNEEDGRDIVRVRAVCWIFFEKTFLNVLPGSILIGEKESL